MKPDSRSEKIRAAADELRECRRLLKSAIDEEDDAKKVLNERQRERQEWQTKWEAAKKKLDAAVYEND